MSDDPAFYRNPDHPYLISTYTEFEVDGITYIPPSRRWREGPEHVRYLIELIDDLKRLKYH